MQKMQISIVFIILAATMQSSKASMKLQELDSVGRMPEITVTAPRYEYQDEAWLGLLEEVVVEARRPSSSRNGTIAEDKSNGMVSGNMSSKDMESTSTHFRDPVYLLISLTLTFATLLILYTSFRAYLAAKEVDDGTTN